MLPAEALRVGVTLWIFAVSDGFWLFVFFPIFPWFFHGFPCSSLSLFQSFPSPNAKILKATLLLQGQGILGRKGSPRKRKQPIIKTGEIQFSSFFYQFSSVLSVFISFYQFLSVFISFYQFLSVFGDSYTVKYGQWLQVKQR